MIRWLIVVLLALLLINWLSPLLGKRLRWLPQVAHLDLCEAPGWVDRHADQNLGGGPLEAPKRLIQVFDALSLDPVLASVYNPRLRSNTGREPIQSSGRSLLEKRAITWGVKPFVLTGV